MSLDWLSIYLDQTEGCVPGIQRRLSVLLLVGVIALVVIAVKTRDLTTTTLALMAVAIAINIGVGSLITALKLPIYLDSIGTVLVGALAGPWAGALTGLLSNLIWSILPVPGGAGPVIAFFAPVAAVIGLMAGFWGTRGVFQMRTEDSRVGGFLALAVGVLAAAASFSVMQAIITTDMSTDDGKNLFVTHQHRRGRSSASSLRGCRGEPSSPSGPATHEWCPTCASRRLLRRSCSWSACCASFSGRPATCRR